MITSENAFFEVQFKNFFIPWKNEVPLLIYSIFHILKHSIKFCCNTMMHYSMGQSQILNWISFAQKLGPLTDTAMGYIFMNEIEWIGVWILNSGPF